jgi:hypothetical protein
MLVGQFRETLSVHRPYPGSQSSALVFGDTIIREGSLTDLSSGHLLNDLPGGGTNFIGAVRVALRRINELPKPRHLWIFTDGDGLGDVLSLAADIRQTSVSTLIVESSRSRPDSALQELSNIIGGRYIGL